MMHFDVFFSCLFDSQAIGHVRLCDCSICQRLHGAPTQWAALFEKCQAKRASWSVFSC